MSKKKTCATCGKEISINAKKCKSCSRKGKYNPAYKHGLKIKDKKERRYKFCVDCGEKIDHTAIRCIRCSNIYRSEERSATWKGGVDAEGYIRSKFNNKLKEYIRKRDENTCQECGKVYVHKGKALDVHHIDYDKINNIPSNLITLCNKCHTRTSIKDREYWYVHFMDKVNTSDKWLKVTWEDACTYASESIEDMSEKKPELVDTFGKIVIYNKEYCLIITHDSRGISNDYLRIPISLVRKIEI